MKNNLFISLIIFLYIIPTFIQFEYSEKDTINSLYFGLPIAQTGDEPHYYITLYSIINDKDIFLTNNYNNALYKRLPDLGKKKRHEDDRHTRLFNTNEKKITHFPFIDNKTINLSYIPSEESIIKEIPGHPPGLPFFAFLFLWPLKNTSFLEHATIYLTLIWSLLGIYSFYKILQYYHKNTKRTIFFTTLFALGTPYWHYSKTFWAEPYLASIFIISWYLLLKKEYFVAGLLLGFGFLIKYPFLLIIIPISIFVLITQKKQYAFIFSIPLIISFISICLLNIYFTGHPLQFNQAEAVQFIFPFQGIINWLLNPTFGLLIHSPILLFFIFGIINFWQKYSAHVLTLLISIFLYFLFWTSYIVSQTGGGGYSARYLLPIIPFLIILSSFIQFKTKKIFIIFIILTIISFIINFSAAFAYPAFINESIIISFLKIINFIL